MEAIFFYGGEYNYIYQNIFIRDYNIKISDQFMICADTCLRQEFERRTDLKVTKNTGFAFGYVNLNYKKGDTSQFTQQLNINHNWINVTIMWKSKSGRIYELDDTDIDCEDIEFWFTDLDVVLIHKLMFPKAELPFKLKGLTFELVVTRLNLDCTIELLLKKENLPEAAVITIKIDEFINDFNMKSEKKDRKDGVIHNWKSRIEDNKLIYDIDLGSVGALFFKKLLRYLSGLNCFEKVSLC